MNIDPQDIIDALAQQRNAAMDEIVRMAAIIKAQERELKKLKSKSEGEES